MAAGTGPTIVVNIKGSAQTLVTQMQAVEAGLNKIGLAATKVNMSVSTAASSAGGSAAKSASGFQSLNNILTGTIKTAGFINNSFMNISNALRVAGQGMMSFGKTMTMFLTPAAIGLLYGMANAAISFDQALIRVKKTTGLSAAGMKELSTGLREMARNTATSHVELAKMAEQIGQTGVHGAKQILELTNIYNMLTVTTDITADKVAMSMGRIAKAFGMDLNTQKGVDQINRLANVINELENNVATTAPEIVDALFNFAQIGGILKGSSEKMVVSGAAMVSTLISVGYSAEEAGTGLRNLYLKVIQSSDKIALLMANTKGYGNAQDVLNKINEDAVKVLVDFVSAAGESGDAARTAAALFEAAGIRGGKTGASLAAVWKELVKNMRMSSAEFERATSLVNEYQMALNSTQSELLVLKNNLVDAGIELGQVFLPVINKAVELAIPLIRKLTAYFAALSPQIQLAVIGGIAFAAALGPVMLVLGQLIFGVGMMLVSAGKLVQTFLSIATAVIKILPILVQVGGAVLGFATSIEGAVTIAVAAIAILLLKFTSLGQSIVGLFLNLIDRAKAWGEGLIASLSGGLLRGAVTILVKVLTAIGNLIAKFFAGHSPPPMGPLSHIDQWGKTLMDTYLRGFLLADFSTLDKVGGIIENVLKSLVNIKKIGDKDQFAFAMEARVNLSELIKEFNKTGKISHSIMKKITKDLGNAADEVETLITDWLIYNKLQEEIAKLEQHKKDTLDIYRQEIQLIAQSNKTAEEKAAAMREAMRSRDEELRVTQQQEDATQKEADAAKAQLDLQQAMIDAMQKQDDLQSSLISSLDKLSGKLSKLGDFKFPEAPNWEIPTPDTKDIQNQFEAITTLAERIASATEVIDAFFAGLQGKKMPEIPQVPITQKNESGLLDPAQADMITTAYDKGKQLADILDRVKATWDEISGIVQGVIGFFTQLTSGAAGGNIMGALGDNAFLQGLADGWKGFSEGIKIAGAILAPVLETIKRQAPGAFKILEAIGKFLASIDWGTVLQMIGYVLGLTIGRFVAGIIILLATAASIVAFVLTLPMIIGTFLGDASSAFSNWAATVLNTIGAWVSGMWQKFTDWYHTTATNFDIWLSDIWYKITDWVSNTLSSIGQWAIDTWDTFIKWAGDVGGTVSKFITDTLSAIGQWAIDTWNKFVEWAGNVGSVVTTWLSDTGAGISTSWNNFWTTIRTVLDGIIGTISEKFNAAVKWVKDQVQAWKDSGSAIIQGAIDGMKSKGQDAIDAVKGIYNKVLAWWQKIWDLGSPSKVMFKSGVDIVQGAVLGIESMKGAISGALDTALGPMNPLNAPSAAGLAGNTVGGSTYQINVEVGSVRDDRDLQRIADAVVKAIEQKSTNAMRLGQMYGG
jgi:TP901 family phage tail tape measure protein